MSGRFQAMGPFLLMPRAATLPTPSHHDHSDRGERALSDQVFAESLHRVSRKFPGTEDAEARQRERGVVVQFDQHACMTRTNVG